MANSRMYLVCRHCGEKRYMAKGYYGAYGTRYGKHGYIGAADEYLDKLEDFFDHHGANCEKMKHTQDNARHHYIILEEGEGWDYETNSIINAFMWDDEKDDYDWKTIKLPDEF